MNFNTSGDFVGTFLVYFLVLRILIYLFWIKGTLTT